MSLGMPSADTLLQSVFLSGVNLGLNKKHCISKVHQSACFIAYLIFLSIHI